jgi:probable phosphoglycerate mutase
MTWETFTERYGDPDWDVDPGRPVAPGGESWQGFVARASTAIAELAELHRGQRVVVACHAGVVEATMLRFLPVVDRHRLGLRTAHTSLTEWERAEDAWRLVRYNDAAHLS